MCKNTSKPASVAGLPGFVIALLLLAPAASRAGEEAASPPSSLQIFKALYAEVEAAVAAGSLPQSTGLAAEELRFGLKTDLIRSDAEIEILKLEAARFAGAEQQEALERLVQAAAAREQRLCAAVRQLEELSGMSADDSVAAAEAAAAEAPATEEAIAEEAGDEGQKKRQKRGLTVVFEAEDLVDNPDS